MPCNKLIEEPIELRWRQPLDKLPRWPHFQHVGRAVYEWPFTQCGANDPGRHVELVILRVHLAGVIFKAPRISRKPSFESSDLTSIDFFALQDIQSLRLK